MEVFSSYEVKITHSTGAHGRVSTTIADSSDLVTSFIYKMWDILYDVNCAGKLMYPDEYDDEHKAPKVVGLTIEYCDDDDSNKIATLQLYCGFFGILIQLLHLEEIPSDLISLLANDKAFVFVGVGIRDTLAKLERDYGIRCKSGIDLGPVASRICRKPQYFDSTLEVLARDIAEINIQKPTIPSLTL